MTDARGREHVLPWAVAAVVLALMGAALSIWRPTAPRLDPVTTDLDAFDPGVLTAVAAYRGPRYALVWAATAIGVLVPILLAATPAGRRLVHRLAGSRENAPWRAGLVAAAVAALTAAAVFPLAAWSRLVHDARWEFRTQSAAGWLVDWLMVSGTRWAGWGLAAALLVVGIRRWPRSWPYRVTVLGTAAVALFMLLHPVVFQPFVLSTGPVPEASAPLVAEVAMAAGEPDAPIVVGDASRRTTRVNAIVTGLGPTRRIVLYDNLLELPPERVAAVVAHEIAHHQHRDVERAVLLSATGLLPALLLLRRLLAGRLARRLAQPRSPFDPRLMAVAMAFAAVVELAAQPAAYYVSRRYEAAADARAVEITADAGTVVRMARAFTVRDLSSPHSPDLFRFVFATHPSIRERIHRAVALADDPEALPELDTLLAEELPLRHPRAGERP